VTSEKTGLPFVLWFKPQLDTSDFFSAASGLEEFLDYFAQNWTFKPIVIADAAVGSPALIEKVKDRCFFLFLMPKSDSITRDIFTILRSSTFQDQWKAMQRNDGIIMSLRVADSPETAKRNQLLATNAFVAPSDAVNSENASISTNFDGESQTAKPELQEEENEPVEWTHEGLSKKTVKQLKLLCKQHKIRPGNARKDAFILCHIGRYIILYLLIMSITNPILMGLT